MTDVASIGGGTFDAVLPLNKDFTDTNVASISVQFSDGFFIKVPTRKG